jgi:hypothetical protein
MKNPNKESSVSKPFSVLNMKTLEMTYFDSELEYQNAIQEKKAVVNNRFMFFRYIKETKMWLHTVTTNSYYKI